MSRMRFTVSVPSGLNEALDEYCRTAECTKSDAVVKALTMLLEADHHGTNSVTNRTVIRIINAHGEFQTRYY